MRKTGFVGRLSSEVRAMRAWDPVRTHVGCEKKSNREAAGCSPGGGGSLERRKP